MATGSASPQTRGLVYSVYRSVVTQYWPFTMYVMAYATAGMALAAAQTGWDWTVWGLAMACIYAGLEGLHSLDLSDEKIAVSVDDTVQTYIGILGLLVGAGLGVYLSYLVSWLFLGFVGVGTFLGIAYNLELFGGLLHDHDTVSGALNFGFSWGFIPAVGGYFLIAETVTFGAVLVGAGILLDAVQLIVLFETAKPDVYEDVGISHRRKYDFAVGDLTASNALLTKVGMVRWVLIAAGLALLFVL